MRVTNAEHIRLLITPDIQRWCLENRVKPTDITALDITADRTKVIHKVGTQ